MTADCGLVLVLASTLAGGLAFRLAGGPAYAHLGRYAPLFAAIGALYAVAFVCSTTASQPGAVGRGTAVGGQGRPGDRRGDDTATHRR